MSYRTCLVSALFTLLLAGCATVDQPIPPELIYSSTASEIEDPAFVRGFDRKDKFPLFDHHTGCVLTIDGKVIQNERARWREEIPIESGMRHLAVAYYHGVFIGRTEFDFEALPGAKYEVRFKENGTQSVDFWIVNLADEKAVTGVKRSSLSGGSGGYVPIFIPAG